MISRQQVLALILISAFAFCGYAQEAEQGASSSPEEEQASEVEGSGEEFSSTDGATSLLLVGGTAGSAGSSAYYQQELGLFGIGAGNVGASGAVEYSYRMGKLTLAYSSQSSEWRVVSPGAVTREIRWGAPLYDDTDIYLLDGMELVYESGVTDRTYHTREQSYARIEYLGASGYGSYWRVTRKDGSIWKYGSSSDSRIEAVGGSASQPRVWALTEWRDAGGFGIEKYIYDEDGEHGGYYLSKVISGKILAAADGYETTTVYYEDIPHPRFSYREGALVSIDRRAKSVVRRIGSDIDGNGGSVIEAYEIRWQDTETPLMCLSLVARIQKYGTDAVVDGSGTITGGTPLPPTLYEYGSMITGLAAPHIWSVATSSSLREAGTSGGLKDYFDVNGDGLPDRVRQSGSTSLTFQPNNGSEFGPETSWTANGSYLQEKYTGADAKKGYLRDYLDLTGDGEPDRVYKQGDVDGDGDPYELTATSILRNSGTDFGSEEQWGTIDEHHLRRIDSDATGNTVADLIDMNGDGLADRVFMDGPGGSNGLVIHFNSVEGFTPQNNQSWTTVGQKVRQIDSSTGSTVYDLIDVNGDGLPDRVTHSGSNLRIWWNKGNGFTTSYAEWASEGSYVRVVSSGHTTHDYMDINGDGLPDRVWHTGTTLNIRYNTGSGFSSAVTVASPGSYLRQVSGNNTICDYLDVNGDGMLDRVAQDASVYLIVMRNSTPLPTEGYLTKVTLPDGGYTQYAYHPVNKSTLNPGYKPKAWVVTTITQDDGLGYSETTQYQYSGGRYDAASRENRGFRMVVITSPTGDKTEAYYHVDEELRKGLVEKEVVKNPEGAIFSYTYYTYEDYVSTHDDHYGNNATGDPLRQERNGAGPDVVVQAVRLKRVDSYLVDGATSTDAGTQPGGSGGTDWVSKRVEKDYDNYGNETSSIEGDYSPGSWGYDKTQINTQFIQDTSSWIFVPKQISRQQYDQASPTPQWGDSGLSKLYYDEQNLGYVNGKGLLTKQEQYYNANQYITTLRSYDTYGNLASQTDGLGYERLFEYETKYRRYLEWERTPEISSLGNARLSTHTQYDNLMRPVTITDPNGVVRTTVYDPLNRVVKVIEAGDSTYYPTVEYEYHDADGQTSGDGTPCAWVLTRRREISGQSGSLDSYSYTDGFGKVAQARSEATDESGSSSWRVENFWDYVQDTHRVRARAMPVFSTTTSFDRPSSPQGSCQYTESYLDSNSGRVKKLTEPSTVTGYEYTRQFWVRAVDALNHVTAMEALPASNERKTHRYTGEYPYQSLYSTSTVKETFDTTRITDPLGNVIEVSKDWLGRKSEYHDPDMGTWSYLYDANSHLEWQRDALGQILLFSYDEINRVTLKDYPGATDTVYSYDQGGAGAYALGRLTAVSYAAGSESYQHDARGRVVSITRVLGGVSRTLGRVYDALNQVRQESYPDGEAVSYGYDSGGNLETVSGTSSYLLDATYTALGKLRQQAYGNGLYTFYDYYDQGEYDPSAGVADSYRLKAINSSALWLSYQYDRKGNVKEKQDLGYGHYENYGYDDLDRLSSAQGSLYGQKSYVYNEIENLMQKDGRTYTYLAAQPHAVESDGRYTYIYDGNGNLVSRSDGRSYGYDADNRLTSVSGVGSYAYEPSGQRVVKLEATITTYSFFPGYEEEYELGNPTPAVRKYYFAGSQRLAQRSEENGLVYFHVDHLGSSLRISSGNEGSQGEILRALGYTPYGSDAYAGAQGIPYNLEVTEPIVGQTVELSARNQVSLAASVEDASDVRLVAGRTVVLAVGARVELGSQLHVEIDETLLADESVEVKHKFTGQEKDGSGLYYYGARYYDPELGRFIQPDTVLDGLNRYAYCRNNPVRYNDPTGHDVGAPGEDASENSGQFNYGQTESSNPQGGNGNNGDNGRGQSDDDDDDTGESPSTAPPAATQPVQGIPFCDYQAWNNAVLQGFNPNSVLGENANPDLSQNDVGDLFGMIPESCKHVVPPVNSFGFSFYPANNPVHVETYSRDESSEYTLDRTTGYGPTWTETRSVTDPRTEERSWVPLDPQE